MALSGYSAARIKANEAKKAALAPKRASLPAGASAKYAPPVTAPRASVPAGAGAKYTPPPKPTGKLAPVTGKFKPSNKITKAAKSGKARGR